ncbi:MAG: hypothetical protein EBS91_01220 [Betaproteobacteria bacterium]|nr:hypothetical protein [Betaproteobacteria bacterium]NCA23250.1 hypothetical protein [Betaproteobacteria bacterium]NDE53292.1 hypothetical protein [Actinomycetota bacterium]
MSATRIFVPAEVSLDQHQRRLEALFKHLTAGEREVILRLVEDLLAIRSVLRDSFAKYDNPSAAVEFGLGSQPRNQRH